MTYYANETNSQPLKGKSQSNGTVEHKIDQDSYAFLDGSIAGLNGVLSELVAIVGQDNDAHTAPLLEIQFGEICTLTSVQEIQSKAYLSVSILLPRHKNADCSSVEAMKHFVMMGIDENWECLWHADKGHNVLVHNISVDGLLEECDLMNAIIESAEQAALWFAVHCEGAASRSQ